MSGKQHDAYVADEFNRAAPGYDDSCIVRSYQRRVQALVVDRLEKEVQTWQACGKR